SGSSHISLNKAPFFRKVVVPTFYPFAHFSETIWAKTRSSLRLNRLTAYLDWSRFFLPWLSIKNEISSNPICIRIQKTIHTQDIEPSQE
ncbi:hypothetical protein, partial [Leptospira interrogans]|uniref:hypothetical protein n=1 Tax=Leptospira interrogans TaxID=173 RepID=UPI001F3200C8